MGQGNNPVIPETGELPVCCFELAASEDPAARITLAVMDQHPVTAKLPADLRAGRINYAGKPPALLIFAHEHALVLLRISFWTWRLFEFVGKFRSIFGQDVNGKDVAGYPVPAVIIPVAQLPFNPDELPETRAALAAPVAFELCHALSGHSQDFMINDMSGVTAGSGKKSPQGLKNF
jgi:hypothetical protein